MDVMAKQESVFTKEHMDRLLAEDRQVDATGKQGFIPQGDNCVRALIGNSAAERLGKLGYFDYEKTRNKELVSELQGKREIRNKPDFMRDGENLEPKPMGFDGYDF